MHLSLVHIFVLTNLSTGPVDNASHVCRPDVMAKYVTRIEADKKLCPVLLSNGNLLEEGELDDNRCPSCLCYLTCCS